MRRQTSFLLLLISIVMVLGLLLIGGCSGTSSVETQSTGTSGTSGSSGTGSASDTPPAIPSSLQRPQGPAAPSQPQGIPGIVVTSNGSGPAFTTDEVRNYIQAHPLASDQQETITRVDFLPTSKVQQLLDGETIGTPPSYMLCYAQLQGTFTFTGWDGTSLTFNTGVMVFDAHTGNLLLEGGLPTNPPVATPTVPRSTPTPTVSRSKPTPTPGPKGGPTATTAPAPTATTPPAPTATTIVCTPLSVSITNPTNGQLFISNGSYTTQVTGTYSGGCGDSIPNNDISWFDNGTPIGNGTSPTVTLSYGNDTVTFQVTDPGNGASASTSIVVQVLTS